MTPLLYSACRATLGSGLVLALSSCSLDDRVLLGGGGTGSGSSSFGGGGDSSRSDASVGSDSGVAGNGASGARGGNDSAPPDGGCPHHDHDGDPDCADTLVGNADFNRSATGWDAVDAFGTVEWSSVDSQSAGISGSIVVTDSYKEDLDGWGGAAAGQCIPIQSGGTYAFAADILIPSGQEYGIGALSVWFFPATDCSGSADTAYANVVSSDVLDRWMTGKGSLIAPDTDHSMSVRLAAQKPFRSKPFKAQFDAIRVTLLP